MRSRSPQRNRAAQSPRASRKRSRSGSLQDTKNKSRKRSAETLDRNDGRSAKRSGNERKDSVNKQKPRNKHSNRRKDSSDSHTEQQDASRKRSRSPRQRSRRSRSRSVDKKRSRGTGHVKKHSPIPPRSSGAGKTKTSSQHSRRRSWSRNRNRSPKQVDKGQEVSKQHAKKKSDRDNLETSEVQKRALPKKRFDQTDLSLNERFAQFYDGEPLVLDETISIEIERNIDGDEAFVIPNFHPHEVSLPHRSYEGQKPLSSRKEFMSNRVEEQDEDKRVVTVVRSFNRESGSETMCFKSGFASRGGNEGGGSQPTLFWKDLGHDTIVQVPIVTSERIRESETEVTSASEHLGQRIVQSRHGNIDQRLEMTRPRFREGRRFPLSREDPRMRQTKGQNQDLRTFRGENRNFDPSGGRRPGKKFQSKITSVVHGVKQNLREEKLNIRDDDKNQSEELPDFSRRPDKYAYDAWMDEPEMIPKGRSYFEHDNRNEDNTWDINRNRGRGGFMRGGGRGRGSFVGRGTQRFQNTGFRKRSGSVESLQWKHDKFETLDDEKPSSTTEK